MEKKMRLNHYDWEDDVIFLMDSKRLYRTSVDNENANFVITGRVLNVFWDKWDSEIFIHHENENIFFKAEKIILEQKSDKCECYIDKKNKILYSILTDQKALLEINENQMEVSWIKQEIIENELNNNEANISNNQANIANNQVNIANNQTNIYNKESLNPKIPNIIHFVYGLIPQTEEFHLYQYLAIESAIKVNKPEKVYFYYNHEPYGYWWDKIKKSIILEKINPPQTIFKNRLQHYAHQADIIRLQKLYERGGIYLDIDTICVNSFSNLLHYDFVMDKQFSYGSTESEPYGLCNAVLLSKKESSFCKRWLDSYESFRSNGRDDYWDEHSVILPYKLSKEFPNEIHVMNGNSFFYPLWDDIKEVLFNNNFSQTQKDYYKKIVQNSYCMHLWDTYSHSTLIELNEKRIFEENTLYNILVRKFIKNKLSLVFLTYNRIDKTKECLESYISCLNNDYIEEMIVLDNNSVPEMKKYLYEFKKKHSKIKIIYSNENLGVCHGRIVLFQEAKGDIICSLDSDAKLINENFFEKIQYLLYQEKNGLVGVSGAFIKRWTFGNQKDISDDDPNEYLVDHIAGCCQIFRRDLFQFGFGLDPFYGKFWVEDTDLSMQSLFLGKKNVRIPQIGYLEHHWGGSGVAFKDLFVHNWNYFVQKWKGRVLTNIR